MATSDRSNQVCLDGGGAYEVSASPKGNYVVLEVFDMEEDASVVVPMRPTEADALIAAIGRALGRPPPALPVTVTAECDGNTFSIRERGMAEPAVVATPLEERIAASLRGAQQAKPFAADQGRAQGIVEVWERALVMVREQAPTVPRAAVARVLADLQNAIRHPPATDRVASVVKVVRDVVERLEDLLDPATPTTPTEKG